MAAVTTIWSLLMSASTNGTPSREAEPSDEIAPKSGMVTRIATYSSVSGRLRQLTTT